VRKKQKADVKSNANSTTTVRRRKRGAASNVPLEKGANGRNRRATATTTAKRGAGSGSRGVRVAEYLLEEVVENHDMRIPIELEKGLMFADTCVFKRALKWYVVQHWFDFKYKYNDRMSVSVVCKEQDCDRRIHASFNAKKESIQIKTFKPDH
jgi:hypothetical protein